MCSVQVSKLGPQAQGAKFENLLCELLSRIIRDDLGHHLLEARIQGSGLQFGKDIQIKWKQADIGECFWHFECKSHKDLDGGSKQLPQDEVAAKVFDVWRSDHKIDAWCLALSDIEPGNAIDGLFAWANTNVMQPFVLTVLSQQVGFIQDLFACHPDLYLDLYAIAPPPPPDRAGTLAGFAQFLTHNTQRARESRLQSWKLLSVPGLAASADDADLRASYLSGREPHCPWEAVVHGWAVARPGVEGHMLKLIREDESGFHYRLLIGGTGEGKSTLMKRVAWDVAKGAGGWYVLWNDAEHPGAASVPTEWLRNLREDTNVLICADGSRSIAGVRETRKRNAELRAQGKRVYLLVSDRGSEWHRSPMRGEVAGMDHRSASELHLTPLQPDETRALAERLDANGLLWDKSIDDAVRRLDEAAAKAQTDWDKPYLLPTLMQLTDPEDQRHADRLDSLLVSLETAENTDALTVLLAASVLHGAGVGLTQNLAERMIKGSLAEAKAVLSSELERSRLSPSTQTMRSEMVEWFHLHHRVIAEAIVEIAYDSDHRPYLEEVCTAIPRAMRHELDFDESTASPEHIRVLVEILDRTADHLDKDQRLFKVAEAFLQSWYALDRRRFPTLHRLAECRLRWLQDELKKESPDVELVGELAATARTAYQQSLEVARDVLKSGRVPPPLQHFSYREDEFRIYHGWAVLEGAVGASAGDTDTAKGLLLRSVMLSLLAIEPGDSHQNARVTGTLGLTLMNLGRPDLLAKVVPAEQVFRQRRDVLGRHEAFLREAGRRAGPRSLMPLAELVAALSVGLLLDNWELIGLWADRREHVGKLIEMLERARLALPPEPIDGAIRALRS